MSGGIGLSVCIIGAGSSGLAATKCFAEEGYDVTTFERNAWTGGLWHYSLDPSQTTCLPGTRANTSKQGSPFSDFPFPDGTVKQIHPTSRELQAYLEAYANQFDLHKHIQLSTRVTSIAREKSSNRWLVSTQTTDKPDAPIQTHVFDRIIIASGPHAKPNMPDLRDVKNFQGEVIHSRAFKEPTKYAGKTVLVVGFNATAADIVEFLRVAGAKKIYVSHRRSTTLMPRTYHGKAIDHLLTRRMSKIFEWIKLVSPYLFARVMGTVLSKMQNETWPGIKEHPAFGPTRPVPQPLSSLPTVSDNIAVNLLRGTVESVHAIDRFPGPRSIKLVDGTQLGQIDAVVCATGNSFDASALLPPALDPSNPDLAHDHFNEIRAQPFYSDAHRPMRLYRGFLSIENPHAIAFLGHSVYRSAWFPLAEKFSMALAQLWKGTYPMPSRKEMELEWKQHYNYLVAESKKGYIAHSGFTHDMTTDRWLEKVADIGIYERTGWGLKAWKLWWTDYPLWKMLVDGVDTSLAMRLFESKRGRKAWPSARAELEKVNREVGELGEKWKAEQSKESA